jgi:hypothetical protein
LSSERWKARLHEAAYVVGWDLESDVSRERAQKGNQTNAGKDDDANHEQRQANVVQHEQTPSGACTVPNRLAGTSAATARAGHPVLLKG